MIFFQGNNIKIEDISVCVSQIFSMGFYFEQMRYLSTQIFTVFNSVERCNQLSNLPTEDNYKSFSEDLKKVNSFKTEINKNLIKFEKDKNSASNGTYEKIVEDGEVEFKNVSARYITSKKLVLKNLTFKVKSGEKIGVVGRTGSGKSSLIKLFWRYIKPSEGKILLDGTDISHADLKSLRSQITIITQETALFSGTLRENLDPTGYKFTDDELSKVIERVKFAHKDYVAKGLDMEIDNSGKNLSQGEKQLICFARCLLKP